MVDLGPGMLVDVVIVAKAPETVVVQRAAGTVVVVIPLGAVETIVLVESWRLRKDEQKEVALSATRTAWQVAIESRLTSSG